MSSLSPVLLGPTPSHAERARTLAARSPVGTLCTVARDPAGYPFGSVVAFAVTVEGDILLLTSDLAEHTKNFREDSRASLLVSEAGVADPLAAERVTLLGRVEPAEEPALREVYLKAIPSAEQYAGFQDFHLFRLRVEEVRYVGGFGRMSWVAVEAWRASAADPLAGHEPGIVQHMNEDHVDAMVELARHFAGVQGSAARMVGVDRHGFEMTVDTGAGPRRVRLGFRIPIARPDDVRKDLVAMLREARA